MKLQVVSMHQYSDWTLEKDLEFKEHELWDIKKGIEWTLNVYNNYSPNKNLGGYADRVFSSLCYANHYGIANYTYNLLHYHSQLNYTNFLIRLNAGKSVQFTIADKEIETIGEFKNSEIGASYVISGIAVARILRNQSFLNFYADIPVTFTEQQNQEDIIWETMMYFYQTLIKGEADINAAASTHHHISSFLDWDEYKKYIKVEGYNSLHIWKDVFEMRKVTVEAFLLPVLQIYHSILHQDQAGYEKAVCEALIKWKDYYTMPKYVENGQEFDNSTIPSGYLALEIAAACAYAYDRGMKLETVESDYIPKWMIEGHFEGFELLIKD
ncbi:MAG: Imm49 family immunity protein [Bacteroidota bacterium]